MADVAMNAFTDKATPVLADTFPLNDSEAAGASKKASLTSIAATVKSANGSRTTYIAAVDATAAEIAFASTANRADGTADDVQIQAALTAGGNVELSGGTFTISTRLTDGGVPVKLHAKENTIIKMADGANLETMLLISAVTGFEWYGGTFDANKANNTAAGTADNGIINTSGAVVDLILDGITLKNGHKRGMHLAGTSSTSNRSVIRNCVILDCGTQGIQGTRDYLRIEGCNIERCGTEDVTGLTEGHHAIKITGDHSKILNNRIWWCIGKAIEVIGDKDDGTGYIKLVVGTEIIGNNCQYNTALGLHLHYVAGAVVTGNTFNNNGNNGIDCNYCNNVVITGNNCSFNGHTRGNEPYWSREGNGIFLFMPKDVTITGNNCISNSNGQVAGDPRSGIRISSELTDDRAADGIIITGNNCVDRRTSAEWTATLSGGITDTQSTITVTGLSVPNWVVEGNFTVVIDSEAMVVTIPTTDSNNFLTNGTWTVVRGRIPPALETFANVGASHLNGATVTVRRTQKYGIDIKSLDADTSVMINNFIIANNRVNPATTAPGYSNEFGTSATKIFENNF
jgi:parallel beta-helix repeat protein